MEVSYTALSITLVCLIFVSAFFSASETAFASLNKIRLKSMAAQGNKKAARTLKVAEDYDSLLGSVLIGNNIVNILSSSLATVLFVALFGNAGISIATIVMTVLVLMFGEISPKTIAKENPEGLAMAVAPVLGVLMLVLKPVNHLLKGWKKLLVRLLKLDKKAAVTEQELLTFVEEVEKEGGINKAEQTMISQAIAFDDMTAEDILTPRTDIESVGLRDMNNEIEDVFVQTGYSRLPVYEENRDKITGVILQKDFFYYVLKQGKPIDSIVKQVVFVPKTVKISILLKTMQANKAHMAIVVDDFGLCIGLVTVEDIVEVLVGDIWDEHDEIEEDIKKTGENTYLVLGKTGLSVMFSYFSLVANAENYESMTVGGWVSEQLNAIPTQGEIFAFENLQITVSKASNRRVMEITVVPEEKELNEEE